MKRITALLGSLALCGLLLTGCSTAPDQQPAKLDNIPFSEGQFYAVAHLGYQEMDSFPGYAELYLDDPDVPVHYISDGDYYLIIPKTPMNLELYRNDFNTDESTLIFHDPACEPFIVQCNVSDIFPDATIVLSDSEDKEEFSPFISLENGEVQMEPGGVFLTLDNAAVG